MKILIDVFMVLCINLCLALAIWTNTGRHGTQEELQTDSTRAITWAILAGIFAFIYFK